MSRFYNSTAWKNKSKKIAMRDNYTCKMCGFVITGRYICDHIKPLRYYPKLAFDEKNLQTLCIECHNKKTFGTTPQREVDYEKRKDWIEHAREVAKRNNS